MLTKYLSIISLASCLTSFAMETSRAPSSTRGPTARARLLPHFSDEFKEKVLNGRYDFEQKSSPGNLLAQYDFPVIRVGKLSDEEILFRAKIFKYIFSHFDTHNLRVPDKIIRRKSKWVSNIHMLGQSRGVSSWFSTALGHLFAVNAVQTDPADSKNKSFMHDSLQSTFARQAFLCGARENDDARFEAARIFLNSGTQSEKKYAVIVLQQAAANKEPRAEKLLSEQKDVDDIEASDHEALTALLERACHDHHAAFFDSFKTKEQHKRSAEEGSLAEPPAKMSRTDLAHSSPKLRRLGTKKRAPALPHFPEDLVNKVLDGRYELELKGERRFLLNEYTFGLISFGALSDTQKLFRAKVLKNDFLNFNNCGDAPRNLKKRRSRFVHDIYSQGKSQLPPAAVVTAFGHLFSVGAVQSNPEVYEDYKFMPAKKQQDFARRAFFCGAYLGHNDARFEASQILLKRNSNGDHKLAHQLLRVAASYHHPRAVHFLSTMTATPDNEPLPNSSLEMLASSCTELNKSFFQNSNGAVPTPMSSVDYYRNYLQNPDVAKPLTVEEKRAILDDTYELDGNAYDPRFLEVVDFDRVAINSDFADEMIIRAKIIKYFLRHSSPVTSDNTLKATSAFVRSLMRDREVLSSRGIIATAFGYLSSARDEVALHNLKAPALSQAFLCGAHNGVADAMFEGAMQLLASPLPQEQAFGVLLLISAVSNDHHRAIRKWEEASNDELDALVKMVDTEENWQGLREKLKDSCNQLYFYLTNESDSRRLINYFMAKGRKPLEANSKVPLPIFADTTKESEEFLKQLLVKKNTNDVTFGHHINTKDLAKALTITEDTDVYLDDDTKEFLFGIRYQAFNFPDDEYADAAAALAALTRSNSYRHDAAGPLNHEDGDAISNLSHRLNNNARGIQIIGNGWKFTNATDWARLRYNTVFSTSFGFSKIDITPMKRLEKLSLIDSRGLSPYLKGMSNSFAQRWPQVFSAHSKGMKIDSRIIPDTVFSTLTINAEIISSQGKVEKNTPRGLHIDNNNKETATLMFALKDNIDGGDLFFPEYGENGIIFSIQSGAVICFKGSLQVHGVTPIERNDHAKPATRVTGIAYFKWRNN